jgi:hypothetical protein
MQIVVAIAGWAGAVIILASYALLSTGRLEGRSPFYQFLNVAGAAGIALNSGWNGAVPSAVLNVIWAGIAIYALIRHQALRT